MEHQTGKNMEHSMETGAVMGDPNGKLNGT